MPLAKAWPEAPRIENAVMFVPKSDSRKTAGPSDAAGEEIVLGVAARRGCGRAKMPMHEDDREIARKRRAAGIIRPLVRVLEVRRPVRRTRTT